MTYRKPGIPSNALRFILSELRKPYGWPGIIMGLGLLLVLGGLLYRASEWLSKAMGWVG